MRSETEADRKADTDEPVRSTGQQEAVLGEELPLKWAVMKPDNLLVNSLKDLAGLYAHLVKKEILTIEKNVAQARKVFHVR